MGNKLSYPEVDLSGKVVIVTGGNTGIGYETAKGLARLGAHTFIACRSKERAEGAIDRMKTELHPESSQQEEERAEEKEGEAGVKPEEGPGSEPKETEQSNEGREAAKEEGAESKKTGIKVEYLPLDLSSFQSTIDCVRAFKEKNLPLHILINNAAICAVPYSKTDDGFESQFHVNHLGPMLLTLELLPLLLDTAASSGDGRIIFVSSYGHYLAQPFDANRLNREENDYGLLSAYSNSKLYNVMSGLALQRRLPDKNITVSSVHPGYVDTELSRAFKDKFVYHLHQLAVKAVGRKPVTGAATSLNCAVNPDLKSQQHFYYDSCRPKQPSTEARSEAFQEQLWSKTFEFLKDYLSQETVEKYGPKTDSDALTGDQETASNKQDVATSEQEAVTGTAAIGEVAGQ